MPNGGGPRPDGDADNAAAIAASVTPAVRALLAGMAARGIRSMDETGTVVRVARALAARLEVDDTTLDDVVQVALLKDVGMLALPDELLRTDVPLDDAQREALCLAPVLAAEIVAGLAGVEYLARAVGSVRERWDGTGYPDRLAGDEIPVAARIVSVADAYDALLNDRPYRPALSHDDTLHVIATNAGTQFWPDAVSALVAMADDGANRASSDETRQPLPRHMTRAPRGPSTTADLVHAAFAATADNKPDDADSPATSPAPDQHAVSDDDQQAARRLLATQQAPTPAPRTTSRAPRGNSRSILPGRLYGGAAFVGVLLGLLLALPIDDVMQRCPPEGEGLLQCQLQKAYLPAITIVIGCMTGCIALLHVMLVRAPAMYGAWRRGDLRSPPPPRFDDDPLLRAANRGLTYRDAHPDRLVRRKRTWSHSDARDPAR
jgi:hypothetical protein